MTSALPPVVQWFQGFEVNNVWHSSPALDPVRVASGTNGVPSKTGAFHAEVVAGNATNWGGYNSVFPTDGYTTSVDIYLDMAGAYAHDTRFNWSSAINNTGGTHRRDFVITGGFYNVGVPCAAYGSGPRFIFSGSTTSPGWPCNPARSPAVVTTTGWYTMKHTFFEGPGNRLYVKMQLLNASGTQLGVWFESDPSDIIGTTVGGNRYGWLVTSGFPFLAMDNAERADLDGSTQTIVIDHADINNWLYYNDGAPAIPGPASPEGPDPTCGSFVSGPGTTPLGTGSSQISVSGERRCNLATYQFAGTPLSSIDTLAYSTYNPSAGNGGSPSRSGYLNFNVDFNGTDTWQRRLLYLPSDNGAVIQDNWQEWDTINGGSALWRYSGALWPAGIGEPGTTPGTTPKSWSTILTTYPGVRMRVTDSFLGIRVGEPYPDGYTENIDAFKFSTGGGTTWFDFEPATTQTVTPAAVPTALDNDYTRVNNAVQAAPAGSTVILAGTFDWTEVNAAASWAKGSDGLAGTPATDYDNYAVLAPVNRNNVTITAASLGAATIQGPGDLPVFDLEGVFMYFGDGDNQGLTISNLQIYDFDLPIAMFNGPGGSDSYNGAKILNNKIRLAADLNATAAPADSFQNIAIHYSFGINQQISGNTIELQGNGVSAAPNYSSEVGMQSNTSGGAVYDGLQITNNIVRVLGAQDPVNPSRVRGIWENGHAHSSDITVSGNQFVNMNVGNNPATNLQQAFWVTSHSSATTTVTYSGNSVSGANIGFKWLGSPEYPGADYSGNQPVRLTSNTIVNNATGILVQNNGVANLKFNRIVGNTTGLNNLAGIVDAENNWWGCNYGPGAGGAGCTGTANAATGTVDANPWLTLTTSASPWVIGLGDTSTVTSLLRVNSDSVIPGGGAVPDGVPASFAATLGTVVPTSSTTSSGVAGTTFFTASAFGSGGVDTTLDSQVVNAAITITGSCPTVSSPDLQSLTGVPVTVPVNTTDLTGRGVISADFTVTYNTAVINAPVVTTTAMTASSVVTVNDSTPGVLVISVFNSTPFVGSGAFLNITFSVIGLPGTSSPVAFAAFEYNEGSPCSNTVDGSVTVISGTITGTITYGNVIAAPPAPRYIPDVTLNAAGSIPASALTPPAPSSNGQYTLSGLGSGPYTVTPSKVGGVVNFSGGGNTITSYDSAMIARHVVGFVTPAPYLPFTPTQIAVADVSGAGGVTSYDAGLIARWVAGLPGYGNTATWIFTPANRSYPNVNANQTGQDYTAILMGDATGNYDQALSPARLAPLGDKQAIVASIPRMTAESGTTVTVPVTIGNTTDRWVNSYQFELSYDPDLLEPSTQPVDLTDSLSEGYFATVNATEPGLLRVVVFGVNPLTGAGNLLSLKFNVIGTSGVSQLVWNSLLLNEGDPRAGAVAGQVRIMPNADEEDQPAIGGRVLTATGESVIGALVTVTDTYGKIRTVVSNTDGVYRIRGVEPGQTYTLTVQARQYAFTPISVGAANRLTITDLIAQP